MASEQDPAHSTTDTAGAEAQKALGQPTDGQGDCTLADQGAPNPSGSVAAESAAVVEAPTQETAGPSGGEQIEFKIQYGKDSRDVKRSYESTVGDLKAEIEKTIGIPVKMQKLMFKGSAVKDDDSTLRQAGLKPGAKLLLIGSVPSSVPSPTGAVPAGSGSGGGAAGGAWDEPKSDEPLHKQTAHAKVLAKGKPEDALAGISGRQATMPDSMSAIPGLLNSQGSKVRLTLKPELQQLWLGSATSTQKIPYNSITKIDATPIPDADGYSIMAIRLGTTTNSILWLYYYPSQYVAGLKLRILGVQSLI